MGKLGLTGPGVVGPGVVGLVPTTLELERLGLVGPGLARLRLVGGVLV